MANKRIEETNRRFAVRFAVKSGLLLLIGVTVPGLSRAQDATEAAAQTASSGATASAVKAPAVAPSIPRAPSIPGSASIPQNASAHLIASVGPSPDEVNRRVLETRAGEEGSKLLMRSIPNRAQIYLNKEFVGHTPLLLIVPPGKYRIEMRGQREENAEKTVGLLAHETREVTMKLPELYPTRITLK